MKRFLVLILALLLMFPLGGCYNRIVQEDTPEDAELPPIDPKDGLSIEQTVMVYYKKIGENRLMADEKTVALKPTDTIERAVLKALLSGPEANSITCEPIIPKGVTLQGLEIDGSIIYVTLSDGFMADGSEIADSAELRRLRTYAVVNSLLAVSDAKSVLILIDTSGKGTGTHMRRWYFGFSQDSDTQMQYMEPMGFELSVIAEESWLPDFAKGGEA